jgi:hypothetical protein
LGVASFFFGWYWSYLRLKLGDRLTGSIETIATDFRVWLGLILLVLLYVMITSIVQAIKKNGVESIVKDDIPALNAAMKAYVLPRTLTDHQKFGIARFLRNYPPATFSMRVIESNREAEYYRRELEQVLKRAHWKIKNVDVAPEAEEGIQILLEQTLANQSKPFDPHNPPLSSLLQEALTREGVLVDSCGYVGADVKEDIVIITVGHRPRAILEMIT